MRNILSTIGTVFGIILLVVVCLVVLVVSLVFIIPFNAIFRRSSKRNEAILEHFLTISIPGNFT
jgi:uncharacterized membrane protein